MTLDIRKDVDRLLELTADEARRDGMEVVAEFRAGLNRGDYRAAENIGGVWRVNTWVKRGILLAFRIGDNKDCNLSKEFQFRDKDTLPLRQSIDSGPRVVPGGSSIRDGVYLGNGVICMPPMYINIGAWIDDGTMIDSHALVGSCAQIGKRVHLSAAAQIGGVLEPPGAVPVIIEDDVFVGGNCGIYEGVIVSERVVLAPGVVLTSGVTVFDSVHGKEYRKTADAPLLVPPGAVLVPGTRPAKGEFAAQNGLSLYAPIIVKYRDSKTDAATSLEESLR